MSESLTIKLPHTSYNIEWFSGLRELQRQVNRTLVQSPGRSVVITNSRLARLYKKEIASIFARAAVLTIPDGEGQKKLETIENLASRLVKLRATRATNLWALGGGVIGDITGFLAAVYMRGVNFYQVPTTLLAMVDSSVGGKTGVNLPEGKNLVGSFYQPRGVFMCLAFLKSLPEREYRCGLAEVIKSALIKNRSFFQYLQKNKEQVKARDLDACYHMSRESVKIKSWVVQKDEKEQNLRAILNFGHTLAHALEKAYNYSELNHGEAVSIGMAFATFVSHKNGHVTEKEWVSLYELLAELQMPRNLGDIKSKKKPTVNQLIQAMYADKKNKGEKIYFVLLEKIGQYRLPEEMAEARLKVLLKEFFALETK